MNKLNRYVLLGVLTLYSVVNLFYTQNTSAAYKTMAGDNDTLNFGYNDLFAASGECYACHSSDPDQIANITLEGQDVNVFDDWRSSMMANSARDPFWQAKVSHEVSIYPEKQEEIESSCVDCHAPQGYFNAIKNGAEHYSMAEMNADDIALDGVACLACHQQGPDNLDIGFSGNLHFVDTSYAYGQYESPLISPMANATGYTPVYSTHTADAALCSSCHTLITETLDYDGNETGNHFVEQATYHEWLNSVYREGAEESTCQKCHLPSIGSEEIIISSMFDVPYRSPYYLHDLVGGNVHMLELLKANIETLNLKAEEEHFDETIDKTYAMLQQNALDLNLDFVSRTSDTAFFALELVNKAGHKFPSGYPARRLHIEFEVKTVDGETIFLSGETEEDFYLTDEDAPYELHHDVITSEDQVQIYEMVMGDVNGDLTTVLTRAEAPLKDNRLVPKGFSTSHESYDTTLVAGLALEDSNFNFLDGMEGSGADIVYYHVPLNGLEDALEVNATVYYQPIPAKWMEEMFATDTEEIEMFEEMFGNIDRTPILVETRGLELEEYVGVEIINSMNWDLYFDGINNEIHLRPQSDFTFEMFTLGGKLINSQDYSVFERTINIKVETGFYLFLIHGKNGYKETMKVFVK